MTLQEVFNTSLVSLTNSGLNSKAAKIIAQVITDAERDGAKSHGLFRLPGYCKSLRNGKISGIAQPTIEDTAPGVVRVHANGAFAIPSFLEALPLFVQKAKTNGIACCHIRDTYHFSSLWWETEKLAHEHGLVAMTYVGTLAFVAHSGGSKRVYGTNPMAFGWPRPGKLPLVWDQASSAMARGEMQLLARDGKKLPCPGIAVDSQGKSTLDPQEGIDGAQLTFGGHKGTSLALLVELLAGALTGSPLATESAAWESKREGGFDGGPTKQGMFIICIDPAVGDVEVNGYSQKAEMLFDLILREKGTRLPAERRYQNREKTPTTGIEIPQSLYDSIIQLSKTVAVTKM